MTANTSLKIAIVGTGAMGSVYAGRLAKGGHEVLVVDAWAEHIAAIARSGLTLSGPDGTEVVPLRAFTVPPSEPVDLVILAVKAAHVPAAAATLPPLLGPDTVVLTIQNGLGSADEVAAVVGADRLAVGIAKGFGAELQGPGRAHHNAMRAMRFGAFDSLPLERVEQVAAAWQAGGFDAAAVADIAAMQWEKLICNVAYSAPCALTGMTVGQVLEHPEMGPVSRAAATEAWQVAKALSVQISVEDPAEFVIDFGANMPAAKPSALLDHEAERVSEIAVINGAVPAQGAKVGVAAPVNSTLTALVKVKEASWS